MKKKILLLLLSFFLTVNGYCAVEDFTTYTEVDVVGDRVTVTSTKCDVNSVYRTEDVWVFKDMGANHFGATWEHDWEVTGVSGSGNFAVGCGYGISNVNGDEVSDWTSGIGHVVGRFTDATMYIQLVDSPEGGDSDDSKTGLSWATKYYCTTERTGETTIETRIYSDSGRTVLVDTLTGVVTNARRFQYVYGMSSYNIGTALYVSYDIENLNLNEAAATASILWDDGDIF